MKLYKELIKIARKYNIESRIHFMGYVSQETLPALYRDAALYIDLSVYEGFGLQILEAMASGTMVFISDRSPMRELIPFSECIIPLENSKVLDEKIIDYIRHHDGYSNIQTKLYETAKLLTPYKMAIDVWNQYCGILKADDEKI